MIDDSCKKSSSLKELTDKFCFFNDNEAELAALKDLVWKSSKKKVMEKVIVGRIIIGKILQEEISLRLKTLKRRFIHDIQAISSLKYFVFC